MKVICYYSETSVCLLLVHELNLTLFVMDSLTLVKLLIPISIWSRNVQWFQYIKIREENSFLIYIYIYIYKGSSVLFTMIVLCIGSGTLRFYCERLTDVLFLLVCNGDGNSWWIPLRN